MGTEGGMTTGGFRMTKRKEVTEEHLSHSA